MTVGPSQVDEAAKRIAGRIRTTPIVEIRLDGRPLLLKLELMQHTGSFKPRGAFNRALAGPPGATLVAASGGNHGLAVAHVAEALGVRAEIFVPVIIDPAKRRALEAGRAIVRLVDGSYADALVASQHRAGESGVELIHAYDDESVIAGAGTTFRELQQQVADVDAVVVGVGGGGFAGGAAAWFGPDVTIIGVETEGTATLRAALDAGEPAPVEVSGLAADSLGARVLGRRPFALLAGRVQSAVITDDEVAAAQRFLWNEVRVVAEPGGAAALAGVLSGRVDLAPHSCPVVVVCGANTDPSTVAR